MAEDRKTVILKFPFEAKTDGGAAVKVNEITLRRMKVKDLDKLPTDDADANKPAKFMPLIAALSGHSEETLGEMDFEDLNAVAAAVAGFYPDSLGKNGDKSSGESR